MLKITQEGETLSPKLVETVIFKDAQGRSMTGLIPDDPEAELPMMKDGRTCIDPEARLPFSNRRISSSSLDDTVLSSTSSSAMGR